MMYGHVKGARDILHTVTLKHSLTDFQEDYGLNADSFNLESQLTIFNRMQNEYIEALKTKWPESLLDEAYYYNALYLLFGAYTAAAEKKLPSVDINSIKKLFKQQFKLEDNFNFNLLNKHI